MDFVVDAVRVLTVFLAGGLMLAIGRLLIHWRTLPFSLDRKLCHSAVFMYAILTAVEQASVVGEPLVWWRLGIVFVATITALIGMALPEIRAWKKPPPDPPPPPGIQW